MLNRPHSLLIALRRGDLKFAEPYLLIAETDHLLIKPMPNVAKPGLAAGYPFHYMAPRRNARTIELVRRFAGSDRVAANVQQVGPSPILVHYDDLAKMVQSWYDSSFALKKDLAADAEFGWMLEMWGYSIGAAVAGVTHTLLDTFQLEPSSQFGVRITRSNDADVSGERATHNIMHYTFSHEYLLEGILQIDSRAGAWGFDKREYGKGLPRHLVRLPRCALESTQVLWNLLHEAMAAHDGGADAAPAGTAAAGAAVLPLCAGCTGGGERWPNGSTSLVDLIQHDKVCASIEQLAQGEASARLPPSPSSEAARGAGEASTRRAALAGRALRFGFCVAGSSRRRGGRQGGAVPPALPDSEAEAKGDPILLYLCDVRSGRTRSVWRGWAREASQVLGCRSCGSRRAARVRCSLGHFRAVGHRASCALGGAARSDGLGGGGRRRRRRWRRRRRRRRRRRHGRCAA